jgi:hypothetical protein
VAERLKKPYFHAYFHAVHGGRELPARFGVVTAHNPRGRKSTAARNASRDAKLRRRLDRMKLPRFRVYGGSRDGSHREAGWAVVTDSRETVRAIAALFEQDAYFWISSGRVLLGSAAGGRLKPAGTWASRRASWRP